MIKKFFSWLKMKVWYKVWGTPSYKTKQPCKYGCRPDIAIREGVTLKEGEHVKEEIRGNGWIMFFCVGCHRRWILHGKKDSFKEIL